MARRANCLLAVAAAAAIVVAGWLPAFADDTIATPPQAAEHGQAGSSAPAAAPLGGSSARAEATRAAPSKPRVVQPSGVPARPVSFTGRERCWFVCGHQMVLMLGVAY